MNKIFLILQREYLIRVRKTSFIVMTILTPLLFAALFILPIWLTRNLEEEKIIEVIDKAGKIKEKIKSEEKLIFVPSKYKNPEEAKSKLKENKHYAVLYIPEFEMNQPKGFKLYSEKSLSLETELEITDRVEKAIEDIKLLDSGLDKKILESLKTDVQIETFNLRGEESSSIGAYLIGFITAFIIYMAVFLYGAQVMRGVVEEKTSRIVEVIISSVKPFQLMMGKILGIGLIGLTQFVLWLVITYGLFAAFSPVIDPGKSVQQQMETTMKTKVQGKDAMDKALKKVNEKPDRMTKLMMELSSFNLPLIIICFFFYFIGGYMLYSSLFAAAASAVDSEAEMQQFTFPISLPLILAIVLLQPVINNPDGSLAVWTSLIPLTSPIIMMIRIPFGVPAWQLIISMALLVISFILVTWLASRIYRIGILMYGKKVTFKELGKWVFYKL